MNEYEKKLQLKANMLANSARSLAALTIIRDKGQPKPTIHAINNEIKTHINLLAHALECSPVVLREFCIDSAFGRFGYFSQNAGALVYSINDFIKYECESWKN